MPSLRPFTAALMFVATLAGVPTAVLAVPSSATADEFETLDTKLPADAITGEWMTEDKKGHVRVLKGPDGSYLGVLSWAAEGAPPATVRSPRCPR